MIIELDETWLSAAADVLAIGARRRIGAAGGVAPAEDVLLASAEQRLRSFLGRRSAAHTSRCDPTDERTRC